VILLIVLLIGLGFLTYKYTPLYGTVLGLFKSSTGGTTTTADTTKPVISNINALEISTTGATITWKTDDLSSSQVEYGTTDAYGSSMPLDKPDTDPTALDAEGKHVSAGVIDHSVILTGLQSGTPYTYRVKSKNAAGLETVSDDETFTTTSAE
jgi:hypothetical protein